MQTEVMGRRNAKSPVDLLKKKHDLASAVGSDTWIFFFKKICMNIKIHESENFLPTEKQLIIMVLLGL